MSGLTGRTRTALAFVLGVVISGGVALAATSATEINSCVGPSGHLRIVNAGASCLPGESALSWNKLAKGDPGPAGPMGPRGLEGPAGNRSTLSHHAHPDAFSSSGADTLTEIPGTRFSIDVPENALVNVGGQAEATLDRHACTWTEGYVIAIDLAQPDYAVAYLSGNLEAFIADDSGPLPALGALGSGAGLLRHTPRGVALPSSASAAKAQTSAVGDPAGEEVSLSFVGDGLEWYEPMSAGRHELALFQYVYGDDGTDVANCAGTLQSSNHHVWVNVLEPSDG